GLGTGDRPVVGVEQIVIADLPLGDRRFESGADLGGDGLRRLDELAFEMADTRDRLKQPFAGRDLILEEAQMQPFAAARDHLALDLADAREVELHRIALYQAAGTLGEQQRAAFREIDRLDLEIAIAALEAAADLGGDAVRR